MDRNSSPGHPFFLYGVALRKESVDRNARVCLSGLHAIMSLSARRAWIEIFIRREMSLMRPSLSARRAWIEISLVNTSSAVKSVALRKESVDRNFRYAGRHLQVIESLSARRAWIEMLLEIGGS